MMKWSGQIGLGIVALFGGVLLVLAGGGTADAEEAAASPAVTGQPPPPLPITLFSVTPSFTLSGLPNTTVVRTAAVTVTVRTPSPGGYTVSVQAAAPELTPFGVGNPDRIPVGNLQVRATGTTTFRPLSNTSAVVVHDKPTPSAPQGDTLYDDYRVLIPSVRSDTYRVTLIYIATSR